VAKPKRLCFFSLNNQTEVKAMQELVALQTPQLVEVKEYVAYGDIAEEAFRKMAASGETCDGLVISGHHRIKGFEGSRVPGYFPTSALEKISCSPESEEWFSKVRTVWLQGCATGEREGETSTGITEKFRALFPHAALFSWSGSAPSRRAPITIPFQLENFSKLEGMKNNTEGEALVKILGGGSEVNAINSWKMLRKSQFEGFRGIANPSAQAYAPLSQSDLGTNRCALLRDSKAGERLSAVRELLNSLEKNTDNLDSLEQETLNARAYPDYAQALAQQIKNSLSKKIGPIIASQKIPLWRKIWIYRLYVENGGMPSSSIKASLAGDLGRFLNKPSPRNRDAVELKTFYDRVFLQAFKKLPTGTKWFPIDTLSKTPSNDALRSALRAMIAERPEAQASMLDAISKNPSADTETLHHLALQAKAISIWNLESIRTKIRLSGRAAAKTLAVLE
jgi:hypothetical protein